MSQYLEYFSRHKKAIEILKYLSVTKEVKQYGISQKIHCSYKTFIREIHKLENLGLVLKEEIPSKTKSLHQNVWKSSFLGKVITFSLFKNEDETLRKIATTNKKYWIVFEEWENIAKFPTAKRWIADEISNFIFRNMSILLIQAKISEQKKPFQKMMQDTIQQKFLKTQLSKEIFGIKEIVEDSVKAKNVLDHLIKIPKLKKELDTTIIMMEADLKKQLKNFEKLKNEYGKKLKHETVFERNNTKNRKIKPLFVDKKELKK